ncbi:hypothetical protein LSM04_002727 [Trypanosoma melophagium]|uniref:uncharacterized protein n=1 Tax=Trypanosoma melophagium TaxID=715481 RepID=UPI00351A8FF5|nr:hypothetical protein LSM04_002727 [Trypanosoma melophagium]
MTMYPKGMNRTTANLTAEKLWTGGSWLEGPYPDTKSVKLFRSSSCNSNGNTLDHRNKHYFPARYDYVILTREHGRRCISASLPPHGALTESHSSADDSRNVTVVDKFANRRFNSPK